MTSRFSLATLTILAIGFPIVSFAQSADPQPSPEQLPAYTIEFIQYRPDGTSARHIEAYKSDGSHSLAGLRKDGTFQVDIVLSAQDQSRTELHHDVRSKTTWYGPNHGIMPWIPKDPTCETLDQSPSHTESMIGKDVFLGFTVVKRMTQLSNGDTYESWQAPALGCKEIFSRHTKKDPDPDELYYPETAATKITLGEPNPVWFEIPADYDERPPSQVREVRYAKSGLTMTESRKESLRMQDEQYWSSQTYKPAK